jgi:hypothetical protein
MYKLTKNSFRSEWGQIKKKIDNFNGDFRVPKLREFGVKCFYNLYLIPIFIPISKSLQSTLL